jgi:hypothetical protein
MAKEHPRLKLGNSAAFVKTRLRRLPQDKETWEADFRAMPKPMGRYDTHYLGMVVGKTRGDILAEAMAALEKELTCGRMVMTFLHFSRPFLQRPSVKEVW